jgi:regulator of sirC expression with transglutaminase-like and TPR domain
MSCLIEAVEASPTIIEDVVLAIAADEYPGLRPARYHAMLDQLVEPIRTLVEQAPDDNKLSLLTEHVYGRLGFSGNADDYYDPRNSYLNQVLERRRGIPISLAVVLMALGRRLDLDIEGIGFPGHFLVRVGGPDGLFVDPFNEGRILEREDLEHLAERFLPEVGIEGAQLSPVGPRTIAVRTLFNLQQIYERRADHARALVCCDRLVDLTDEPFHRRDRGTHAFALGAYAAARPDLEAYLERSGDAQDVAFIHEMLRAIGERTGKLLH